MKTITLDFQTYENELSDVSMRGERCAVHAIQRAYKALPDHHACEAILTTTLELSNAEAILKLFTGKEFSK